MDPQHRIFLECCWEAMERAAMRSRAAIPGPVGVFAGESMNTYLLMNLLPHMELVASADTLQASLGNDKDPLTARVAYKLNLKGPSLTVQTASSTSLAAVHTACRFLLQGDCDMALAGGVSIHLPEVSGYMFEEGRDHLPGRPLPGVRRAGDRLRQRPRRRGRGAQAARRRPGRRRPHPRRDQGLGLQQRRLAQGELHGAQRRGAGGRLHPRLRGRRGVAGDGGLRRVPRHGHGAGRSDRDHRALPGLRRSHGAQGVLRHRLAQDEHRPSGHRGRRVGADQGRSRPGAQDAPGEPPLRPRRTRRSTSREARSSSTPPRGRGRSRRDRAGPA